MEITDEVVAQVWEHGRVVDGHDPTTWRKDECGAWIRRGDHGSERSGFGWRVVAVCVGEPAGVEDLRPFHADNRYDREQRRPHCRVTADPSGHANRPA